MDQDDYNKTARFEEESPQTQKREIPKNHSFDPKALKPMAKALWACSVSMGHALTAYRHFTRLKSTTISPDGRIGGRGYIRDVSQVRKDMYDVCETLSSISDTLFDEINAPHWKPKLALLDENEQEDVERFIEESKGVIDNPEEDAEEEIKKIEEENDGSGADDSKSELPGGGETTERTTPEDPAAKQKQASVLNVVANFLGGGQNWEVGESRLTTKAQLEEAGRTANPVLAEVEECSLRWGEQVMSGLDCQTGGPRVDNKDPMGGDGPHGSFNPQEDATEDDWGLEGARGYDYPGTPVRASGSTMPSDDTPTEAWDWGLGFGARGQGAGGYANPSDEGNGKGIWGPHSGLPGSVPQSSGDSVAPVVDMSLNERHSEAELPNDGDDAVARRDEYEGAKGNLVQTAQEWADSLPGAEDAPSEVDIGVGIDTSYVHEDLSTPWMPLTAPGTMRTE